MLTNVIAKVLIKFLRIEVVHSIPGRLRIKITGMEKVKKYFSEQKQSLPETLSLYKLKGIHTFDLHPITAKALIEYDPLVLSEQTIVKWLQRLQELIIMKIVAGARRVNQEIIDEIANQIRNEGYELETFNQNTTA